MWSQGGKNPSQALEWLPKPVITLRKQNIVSKYPTAGTRGKGSQCSAIMDLGLIPPQEHKGALQIQPEGFEGISKYF